MRLILIGFGVVGQGFVEIVRDKADTYRQRHNFSPTIVGVATRSRGVLYHPDGLQPSALLEAIAQGHLDHYPNSDGLERGWDVLQLIQDSQADVMLEASLSDLETAQPALDYCIAGLESGKHLVLANKGPVALFFDELMTCAKRNQRHVRLEATVMAGTPAIQTGQEALAGCSIRAAKGILNGTTNYILTQMEDGLDYESALQQAQALGYAEADPRGDVEGWDAAGKVLILANALFGKSLKMSDLSVEGITNITTEMIQVARTEGETWKLIATVTPDGGHVRPVKLPRNHPLASVRNATNAITFETDLLGDVILIGAGAGKSETGVALLNDCLAIHRHNR